VLHGVDRLAVAADEEAEVLAPDGARAGLAVVDDLDGRVEAKASTTWSSSSRTAAAGGLGSSVIGASRSASSSGAAAWGAGRPADLRLGLRRGLQSSPCPWTCPPLPASRRRFAPAESFAKSR